MLNVNLPLYRIDGKTILRSVSFELPKSKNMTILGANGAGKSTLAKLLCGLYRSRKAVKIGSDYIETLPAMQRSRLINYIPPKLNIYERFMTVEDFLGLSRYRRTEKEEQFHEVLSLLGLQRFSKSYCMQLSSGEQQLLLLASALMHRAEITIFDEPTSNLDPQKIKIVFEILQSQRLKQKIVITHDLQLAYKLDYPVLYLKEGEGIWYERADMFFDPRNLDTIFAGSVTRKCDAIVVTL